MLARRLGSALESRIAEEEVLVHEGSGETPWRQSAKDLSAEKRAAGRVLHRPAYPLAERARPQCVSNLDFADCAVGPSSTLLGILSLTSLQR